MKMALLVALVIVGAAFLVVWMAGRVHARRSGRSTCAASASSLPTKFDAMIGFFTNFFDTLGIGSFATTSSMFKLWRLVPDELIPGTLNVGHTIPVIVQAFIYIGFIQVDVRTLAMMISASVMGAWLGAGVVAAWPRRTIQVAMAIALLAAAALLLMTQLNLFPAGGTRLSLEGLRLWIALPANFLLGALNTMGIGLYAPCMILVSLLGMDPRAAFPIMMGSCAFLMPVGSIRFIRSSRYSLKAGAGLALGGVPGVLLAAFLVRSLPLVAIRWLVVCVVIYTAGMMLRSATLEYRSPGKSTAGLGTQAK